MFNRAFSENQLDRWAIGLSGLCLAHCLLSAVVLTLLASAGSVFLHPAFHEVGLLLAMGLAAVALGRGVLEHGYAVPAWVGSLGLGLMAGALTLPHDGSETVYSIFGVLIVALGHDLNRRAAH
ncbi:MAG: MerC domain-containing protein [Sphingomonadaceae bacterium]